MYTGHFKELEERILSTSTIKKSQSLEATNKI